MVGDPGGSVSIKQSKSDIDNRVRMNEVRNGARKILDYLIVTAIVALVSAVIIHEVRLSRMESDRSWLKEDIMEIKANLKSIDNRLQLLERKIQ